MNVMVHRYWDARAAGRCAKCDPVVTPQKLLPVVKIHCPVRHKQKMFVRSVAEVDHAETFFSGGYGHYMPAMISCLIAVPAASETTAVASEVV